MGAYLSRPHYELADWEKKDIVSRMQEKRTVCVTGGGIGIGKAISTALLDSGYDLMLHYYGSEEGAQEVLAHGTRIGRSVTLVKADFCDSGQVLSLAQTIKKACSALHAVVHCAGVNEKVSYENVETDSFERTFAINVKAPIFLTQQLIPSLSVLSPSSSVVCIGSTYSYIGGSMESMLYSVSKTALIGFVRTLARNKLVRANLVVPGYIDAPSLYRKRAQADIEQKKQTVPLGRIGQPQEVGSLVRFLLSEEAMYINGQAIHQDGGLYFS